MLETRSGRLGALAVLFLILVGAFLGYGMLTPDPQAGRYPRASDIAAATGTDLGDQVVISGPVIQTSPLIIEDEYSTVRNGHYVRERLHITVNDVEKPVTTGTSLQVYGTLVAPRQVRAINTVVVPASNYLYMYAVSFIAGLWVLWRILRDWRLDWQHFRIVARSRPLKVRHVLTSRLPASTEDDTDA